MVNTVFAVAPKRRILRPDLMSGSEKSEADLFTEAVRLPADRRSAFLEAVCGSKVEHFESNTKSALLHLDDRLMEQLNRLTA